MKRATFAAALCGSVLVSALGLLGCDRSGGGTPHSTGGDGAAGATAVVDLDKVARDLGWQAKLTSNLQTYRTQLEADVKSADQKYSEQIKQEVSGMVPPGTKSDQNVTLTAAQSQKLSNLIAAGRQQLGQVAQAGNEYYNRYRVDWIKQYREALGPIVRQVAEEKKMNVVFVQGEQVLFADRAVDLTDAVVDAARAKPPALTEVGMSHIDYPQQIQVGALPQTGGVSATQPSTPTSQP